MQHHEFEPPQELRDVIKCFWYDRRDLGKHSSGFEVVPDGYAEIIFHFGSPCHISSGGNLQLLPSPFLMGLLNQPVSIFAKGCLEIIGIRCFPWTVFDLLGLPSGKNGVRLFEHPVASLQSSLHEKIQAGRREEAISEVTHYFLSAIMKTTVDNIINKAGVAMRKANGTLPVSEVAAAAHATVRTLERNFKQSSGYTVKDVSGLIRFEQARNQLWIHPDTSLAALAVELGYTDQAHLTREFKRYSGATPAAFARKAKRERLLDSDFVAFVQA